MPDPRPRHQPHPGHGPADSVPHDQARALERRHALARQQRGFRTPGAIPTSPRPRPPA